MASADINIIKEILSQSKGQLDASATDADFFEFFSASYILRDYSLSPDEIRGGIVSQEADATPLGHGKTDGGIDSMFLLVNGKLIQDLEQAKDPTDHKTGITVDVIIIQSKAETGFAFKTMDRLSVTSENIFDFSRQLDQFGEKYIEPLLETIEWLREVHKALVLRRPEINVYFRYATLGDTSVIDPNVSAKAQDLERKVRKLHATVTKCEFQFIGARELITLFNKSPKNSFSINCFSSISDSKGGRVALVEIGEYFKLISDNGVLRESLFEANVRDYEGENAVNEQIRNTLDKKQSPPFWWLNNGITILAEKVWGTEREIHVEDPHVVNGLQTSKVIFDYMTPLVASGGTDTRHCVVRIIESPDNALQDEIIKATNSQTKIPPRFLRATDEIQRDIEIVFRSKQLHYDRRKNSWRKNDLPLSRVVGMNELAQSVAALILHEPDHARARPSRYFKDGFYEKVFTRDRLEVYATCAVLKKRAAAFLKTVEAKRQDRNNLMFYVLTAIARITRQKRMPLATIDPDALPESILRDALAIVRPIYEKHGANDRAAKGPLMVADLKASFSRAKSRTARRVPPRAHKP
jgi:hypothetical protein